MIESPVLERVLSEALRHGGEFAEVFAEDRSTSSALLDDGRVEELSSGRERGPASGWSRARPPASPTPPTCPSGSLRAAEAASAVARNGGGGTRTVEVPPLRDPNRRRPAAGDVRAPPWAPRPTPWTS